MSYDVKCRNICIAEKWRLSRQTKTFINEEPNLVRSGGDGLDVRVGYGIL